MQRWMALLAVGLTMTAACACAQNGYQYSRLAPDPSIKAVQIPESVLMRAAYEARNRDCVDSRQHLDDVLKQRPNWAPVYVVRLICARNEGQALEERDALNALMTQQPDQWIWWHDSAVLHAKDAEFGAAVGDITKAISLRSWDEQLFALRSEWRERLRDYNGAYADATQMHLLRPELGAPLERMAKLVEKANRPATEAPVDHALAELNPETLPMGVRDDSDLPVAAMSLQELLLRANYAVRVRRDQLALKLVQAILTRSPNNSAALEMYYPLWKRGVVDADQVRAAVIQLVHLQQTQEDAPAARRPASGTARPASAGRSSAPSAVPKAEYYRWLLEIGGTDEVEIYKLIIAAEPYDAKNYADLGSAQLQLMTQHGAFEPGLPTAVPGLNGVPPLPSGNPANHTTTFPMATQQRPPQVNVDGTASDSAEQNFRTAISLDPGQPAYYFGLGKSLGMRAAFPLEIMALNMALIGDPDNRDYQATRAKLP